MGHANLPPVSRTTQTQQTDRRPTQVTRQQSTTTNYSESVKRRGVHYDFPGDDHGRRTLLQLSLVSKAAILISAQEDCLFKLRNSQIELTASGIRKTPPQWQRKTTL
jgi:LAS superfamily LD-carboxypeptidase LdcB